MEKCVDVNYLKGSLKTDNYTIYNYNKLHIYTTPKLMKSADKLINL